MDDLNPAQRKVIELLGRTGEETVLPDDLADGLHHELHAGLADLASELTPEDPLWVSKHALATIHGCEAHHAAGNDGFEWNVNSARGTIAHKAIEVLIHHRGEAYPSAIVDEAVARLLNDERSPLGAFLGRATEYDLAELRAAAVAKVSAFQECFPPMPPKWLPVVESKSRVDLFGGRVVLSGKTDLTLGRPGRKVIIDLKTGWISVTHREDLRFYALVETLRLGVAPRKLATYYLDSASTHPEDVTVGTLQAAVRRTVDGVRRIIEVTRLGEEPGRRPGPQCRWCPLAVDCEVGSAALTRAADPDLVGSPW